MNDPIDNYFFLNAGTSGVLKQFRAQLQNAHSLVDSNPEQAKQEISEAYKGLQIIANGLNHSGRWQALGNSPVSGTTPAAPEIDSETIEGL